MKLMLLVDIDDEDVEKARSLDPVDAELDALAEVDGAIRASLEEIYPFPDSYPVHVTVEGVADVTDVRGMLIAAMQVGLEGSPWTADQLTPAWAAVAALGERD